MRTNCMIDIPLKYKFSANESWQFLSINSLFRITDFEPTKIVFLWAAIEGQLQSLCLLVSMYSIVTHLIYRSNKKNCILHYLKTLSVVQLRQSNRHQCSKIKNSERTASWAAELIHNCSESERKQLYEALENASIRNSQTNDSPLTFNQLRLGLSGMFLSYIIVVFLASATPFIGFGFLDNCLMIIAVRSNSFKICDRIGRICWYDSCRSFWVLDYGR